MRAVSLSDASVKELLAERFVCTWADITADPNAGTSHPHACTDQASDMAGVLRDRRRTSIRWVTIAEDLELAESEDAVAAAARRLLTEF